MKPLRIAPIPAVLLAILSVQGGAAIAKNLFPIMGPVGTTTLRIVISAIILMLFNKPNIVALKAKQWQMVTAYGIVLGAMNLSFYLSLARIPLGLAVTLEFIGPLTLALISSRKTTDFLWVILAAAGIYLIAPWSSPSSLDTIGILLALLAGFFWACYILIGSRTVKLIDSKDAVSVGMCIAGFVVLPFAFSMGNFQAINYKYILLGFAVAIFSSVLPYSLEMNALKKIPAKTFSILMSLEPAVAAFCGLLFLNEKLTITEWFAILLVIVASAGASFSKINKIQNNNL